MTEESSSFVSKLLENKPLLLGIGVASAAVVGGVIYAVTSGNSESNVEDKTNKKKRKSSGSSTAKETPQTVKSEEGKEVGSQQNVEVLEDDESEDAQTVENVAPKSQPKKEDAPQKSVKVEAKEEKTVKTVEVIEEVKVIAKEYYKIYAGGELETDMVRITALYAGIALQFEEEEREQVTIVTDNGELVGAKTIMRYLSRNSATLLGENEYQRALVDSWLDWAQERITSPINAFFLPVDIIEEVNYFFMKDALEELLGNLSTLNTYVSKHTFLAGRFVSLADIFIAMTLGPLFEQVLAKNHVKQAGQVLRWVNTVLEQPEVSRYNEYSFSLCKKTPIPSNPPKTCP